MSTTRKAMISEASDALEPIREVWIHGEVFAASRVSMIRIFADGAYAGRKMAMTVWRTGAWRLQIVKRSDAAGFEVIPKRWIVERTFAWISRNRRLARDFERYATTVAAFFRIAMIRIMLRRLAANTSP